MRHRFNRNAICSSENYKASRKAHLDFLEEKHNHFCGMMISGEIQIDIPTIDSNDKFEPKYKTVKIFGKDIRLTIEEYNTWYAKCNF